MTLLADRQYATLANAIVSVDFSPNGTHFEPQRASVRAGRLVVVNCKSGPHAWLNNVWQIQSPELNISSFETRHHNDCTARSVKL